MKIGLCNEVVRELDFVSQCRLARDLGYDGLELAPFTLSENPHQLPQSRRAELRRMVREEGLEVSGLHWLLLTPKGLSINSPDVGVRDRTVEVMRGLIDLCADLGGTVLIHGSPAQRQVMKGDEPTAAWQRARDLFATIAENAAASGVVYCIEPLAPADTNFINTVAEAAELVSAVAHPAFQTMLDTCAARNGEQESPAQLLHHWLPSGKVRHVHVNDRNRQGPGQGKDEFGPVFRTLIQHRYGGWVGVEPFDYRPDGAGSAARAIGYIRGLLEPLSGI
ncbi:MAG: sugar phosphate isomerase/epimerase family protein [Acidobacteriota bacterium]